MSKTDKFYKKNKIKDFMQLFSFGTIKGYGESFTCAEWEFKCALFCNWQEQYKI